MGMLSRVPVEFSDKIKLNIKNNLLIINSIKVWQEISEYIDRRGVKSMLSQIQVLARSDLYTNFRGFSCKNAKFQQKQSAQQSLKMSHKCQSVVKKTKKETRKHTNKYKDNNRCYCFTEHKRNQNQNQNKYMKKKKRRLFDLTVFPGPPEYN